MCEFAKAEKRIHSVIYLNPTLPLEMLSESLEMKPTICSCANGLATANNMGLIQLKSKRTTYHFYHRAALIYTI